MFLETKILTFGNDFEFVYVQGMRTNMGAFNDINNTEFAKITYHNLNTDTELDITKACTVIRAPSIKEEEKYRESAKGQYGLYESDKYRDNEKARYLENYKEYNYRAELCKTPQLYLPSKIASCGDGKILVGIIISHTEECDMSGIPEEELFNALEESLDDSEKILMDIFKKNKASILGSMKAVPQNHITGILRLVDVKQGNIIFEETKEATDIATAPRHFAEFVAVNQQGTRALFHHIEDKNIFSRQKIPYVVEKSLPELNINQAISEIPLRAYSIVATNTHWITISDENDTSLLKIIEQGSGKLVKTIPLKNAGSLAIGGNNSLVAIGNGDSVDLVDIEQEKIIKTLTFSGLHRNDSSTVALSKDGNWLATSINNEKLILTRLADCCSVYLMELKRKRLPGKNNPEDFAESIINMAFDFVGNTLIVVSEGEIHKIKPEYVDFNKNPCFLKSASQQKPVDPFASLEELLESADLLDKLDLFKQHYSPGVMLTTEEPDEKGWLPSDSGGFKLGASHFGGWPDLPKGSCWPMWEERPMAFLGQLNLEEMHQTNPQLILPKSGLLSFFLSCEAETTVYISGEKQQRYILNMMAGSENDKEAWKVIYTPTLDDLEQLRYVDTPEPEMTTPCRLSLRKACKTLPREDTLIYEHLELTDAQRDRYNELLSQIEPEKEEGYDNQLMGYWSTIQGHFAELSCEQAARGLDPYKFYDDKELEKAATEWTLILQLTSDNNAGFMWGDDGNFYFYGKRDKIIRGDFSDTWVYFECF